MGKQFGDDVATLNVITSVLKLRMSKGELRPGDIDQMENEIFTKLSNVNRGIALDQFHPRLVANAKRKLSSFDQSGMPLINDTSVEVPPADRSISTQNQGYRKHAMLFKLTKTRAQPSMDLQDINAAPQYGFDTVEHENSGASTQRQTIDQSRNSIIQKPKIGKGYEMIRDALSQNRKGNATVSNRNASMIFPDSSSRIPILVTKENQLGR